MTSSAITVNSLSKSYRLGVEAARAETIREAFSNLLRSPARRIRDLREMKDAEKTAFWALRDVSFEVPTGQVVGIIGKNGAGKSTLLKILSRIVEPTSGEIRIRGRVASLLEVGTGFHPELTGRENIFLNGSILGMQRSEIAKKFDEIVDFAGLERFLDTPVKRYSSGMYVRLAFSVAAHLESDVLIIDEVLAVGDASFQQKCLGKVKNLTAGGARTVLFVSHNLTTVRSLCDRVIWLKSGEVVWDGAVGPAIEDYLTEDLGGEDNSFDVEQCERVTSSASVVRLTRITFNEGQPIRHGEPLVVDIHYRASHSVEAVAFGITISSPEAGRIMCIDTDINDGTRYDIAANTSGCVRLRIEENYLQPSRYAIGAISRTGENHSIDYLPYFAQIDVLESSRTPAILVGRTEAGCVRIPSQSRLTLDQPAADPTHAATSHLVQS